MIIQSNWKFNSAQHVLEFLNNTYPLAVDIETYDINDRTPLGLAIAWSPNDAVYFEEGELPQLKLLFMNTPMIYHNVLFDVPIMSSFFGLSRKLNFLEDTMLMAQSMGYPPALGDLSSPLYFNFPHSPITSLLYENGKKVKGRRLKDCDTKDLARLCNQHAMGTRKIWSSLTGHCPGGYLDDKLLLPLLMRMHDSGIRINPQRVDEHAEHYLALAEQWKQAAQFMGFNPASPKQIGFALADRGLFTRMKKSGMSTDEASLLPYKGEPIVDAVLNYRENAKMYNTYLKPHLNKDRLYPQYHIVRTGRFASTKPNIQNQPPVIRDIFIPEEGEVWWDADLHQIEPVVMGFLSGDKKLQELCRTGDVYLPIAQQYHIQRYTAKQLLLAGAYGAGAGKIQEVAAHHGDKMTKEDAENLLTQFKKDYYKLVEWGEYRRQNASVEGAAYTMLGRKRTLEDMASGERAGYDPLQKVVNTIVQGTAAEVLKRGMLKIQDSSIRATIHDEILVSTKAGVEPQLPVEILGIPVQWDIAWGSNWLECKEGTKVVSLPMHSTVRNVFEGG
jgi:hypothetical protein